MPGEKITVTLPCTAADEEERFICMITKKGIIKRTKLSDFKNTRKSGIIAISIDEDDEKDSDKLKQLDEEAERYHEINEELEKLESEYEETKSARAMAPPIFPAPMIVIFIRIKSICYCP